MDNDREPEVMSHDRVPPEQRDLDVECWGCGKVAPVSEMGITADAVKGGDEDGPIRSVERRYICGEDCSEEQIRAESSA